MSVVSFVIIFFHYEVCLFTLLIVSFAVQKLLSLIRSHLFTLVFPVLNESLFLTKETRIYNGEKTVSLVNAAGNTVQLHINEWN